MTDPTRIIGRADAALDERLRDELDKFNAAANPDFNPAEELTVRVDEDGELVAGLSGWTWGHAAGLAMTWVHEDKRGTGMGATLIAAFEDEARKRGCTHAFVLPSARLLSAPWLQGDLPLGVRPYGRQG